MTERNILMKTFKQYISESGVWDQGTGGGFFAPWKPLPNSGGRNVVPAGSIKPPKRPVPTSVQRHELYRDRDGQSRQLPTDDYPDTQEPPPGVLRQWPGENTSQIPV